MMKAMKKADNKSSSLEEVKDVCWTHLSLLFLLCICIYGFFFLFFMSFFSFVHIFYVFTRILKN